MERDGTMIHKLWWCETNDKHRDVWGAQMEKEYPGLWSNIKQMTITQVTEKILGRGDELIVLGKETCWESLHPTYFHTIYIGYHWRLERRARNLKQIQRKHKSPVRHGGCNPYHVCQLPKPLPLGVGFLFPLGSML